VQRISKDLVMRMPAARTDTADRILDLAERLVQTRGFNGFSYAVIASELGVTKASLHYHFPSKAELGRRLIDRYGEAFARALAEIDGSSSDAREKLRRYTSLYSRVLRDGRMCMCGMLAADYATLPEPMKSAVTHFFEANEQWLASVLEQGRARGDLRFSGAPLDVARWSARSRGRCSSLARLAMFPGSSPFQICCLPIWRERPRYLHPSQRDANISRSRLERAMSQNRVKAHTILRNADHRRTPRGDDMNLIAQRSGT
jgi:TetR/AcrR family transcriptional repressor of nem operon